MPRHKGARRAFLAAFAMALFAAVIVSAAGAARGNDQLSKINHIVVIYEENHSFDNLYGGWEGVNGLATAAAAQHATQVDEAGTPFDCLLQNDVNLTSPPLSVTCTDAAHGIASHFTNNPFSIEAYLPKEQRVFGYFALPVLVGDKIVAAIDLKTDRDRGKLLVRQWTWVGTGSARRHKKRIEEALHRFERFQLAR